MSNITKIISRFNDIVKKSNRLHSKQSCLIIMPILETVGLTNVETIGLHILDKFSIEIDEGSYQLLSSAEGCYSYMIMLADSTFNLHITDKMLIVIKEGCLPLKIEIDLNTDNKVIVIEVLKDYCYTL